MPAPLTSTVPPAARAAVMLLAVLCVWGAGCVVHLDRNAPGLADVSKPPDTPQPSAPAPVVGQERAPRDPGERRLVVLPGAAGGGGMLCHDGSCDDMASVSAEATVLYGESETSHHKPTLFGPLVPLLLPRWGFGGTLGAVVYQDHRSGLGPLYLEGEASLYGLFSGSVGYAVDFTDGSHGPQVTLSAIGLYVRTTYLFGRGTEVLFGMVIKLPVTLVWSR